MRDRIEALGGCLTYRSVVGTGAWSPESSPAS